MKVIKLNYATPALKAIAVVPRALVCDVSGGNEDIVIDDDSDLGGMDD